jgi:hypothetical protein
MLSSSSDNFKDLQDSIVKKLREHNDRERKTVRDLKRIPNEIHIGKLTREGEVRDLLMMSETNAQGVGVVPEGGRE